MQGLVFLLSTIRWQDLVDIVINSYILFRLYVVFEGTNAFRILVGIASLWILQEVAASLGLILTSWALQGITAAAAIIIVVVFRNEIRSALQVQNLKTFLWGAPQREHATSVEIIVDSVYQMGKKRTGALIVFPGKEDLKEVVHGGIAWNGTVSQEMITSIFWPDNPVHDGAVIAQGNRITEVGVLLPLSQRQDLPSFYGTRHRAAAGLAERTDALVIVVSEERGRVSVAKDNSIKPIAQPEELLQILREHLNLSEGLETQLKKREKLKFSLAAAFSLLIMTGIWFGFTRSQDTVIALDVPVEYVNRPTYLEILDTSVNQVRIQLNGSSALIKSLRPGQVQVRMDLTSATEGKNLFPVSSENVLLPPGVFLNKSDPTTVEVTLDRPIVKELPIQVDWVGKLPENVSLVDAKLTPGTIRVVGGKEMLEKINTIYTIPVSLESLVKSDSITAALVISPPSLKLDSGSSDKVTIHYSLEKKEQAGISGR